MAKIINDALSEQDIKDIYKHVKASNQIRILEIYNQEIVDFMMPETIKNKIVELAEEAFEVRGLELIAYQFARYENRVLEDGTKLVPVLYPHFDTFEEKKYTFDLQLDTNTYWDIVVEDEQFSLDNNQALTFSGTHDIHWRVPKVFEDGEFVEMLFCHLNMKNAEKLSNDHIEIMLKKEQEKEKEYLNKL